ncbi:MAG: hypothetical protein L0228_16440 [Planctomycetes bacterium]|nr:hypothetical protein [Planctomycetota bacterium]
MIWVRSIAAAVILCAANVVFAVEPVPFGSGILDTTLATPFPTDPSFSTIGGIGPLDFASTKIPLQVSGPAPTAAGRLPMDGVPLVSTSWQAGYSASSPPMLLDSSDPLPWSLSYLPTENSPPTFGTPRGGPLSMPRLMPDLGAPITQPHLFETRWSLGR